MKDLQFQLLCWIVLLSLLDICSESPEMEVLSHLVSLTLDVDVCGEIGFDAFALIVCVNLLCKVSVHPLIYVRFADEIMFFSACYQLSADA